MLDSTQDTPPDHPSNPEGEGESSKSNRPRSSQRPRRSRHHRRPKPGSPPEEKNETQNEEQTESVQASPNHPKQVPQQSHSKTDVSVVIPLYNEEGSLKELHQELRATFSKMNVRYELLFVDDGSTDKSFQILRDIKRHDHRIKVIRFRRNFGKSAALAAGFEKAAGEFIITMDADLQDNPAEIPGLLRKLREGFDLVSGWKKVRRDPITKTLPSRFFNFVTALLTGIKIHDFNCGLKAYRSEVVKSVNVYGELHRYVPVLAHWQGFKVGEMEVTHRRRRFGKTKFGLGRFWKGFLDLVTVLFTTRYFRRPLHLFGVWGIIAVTAGAAIVAWLSVEWFLGLTALGNRPLFLVGILLIIVGIQFVSIGLLGEMIAKTKTTEQQYSVKQYIK